MAVPAPRLPAPRLAAALAELLSRAGARAVRVVDGTGTVVATAGADPDGPSGSDDPSTVVALLREATAFGSGGLDDVVVTTDRSVHVLRRGSVAGVFVHLWVDRDGADTARARHALADPAFHEVVRRAVAPGGVAAFGPVRGTAPAGSLPAAARRPGRSVVGSPPSPFAAAPAAATPEPTPSDAAPSGPAAPVPLPGVAPTPEPAPPSDPAAAVPHPRPAVAPVRAVSPVPASPVPVEAPVPAAHRVPAPRTAPGRPVPQQPALAGLVADRARTGDGVLAAVALAELSRPDAPPVVLPRRRAAGAVRSVPAPRPGGTVGLPDRAWARDLDTLRRLADGLRRLS
ncbi:hypothetical protein ACFFTK_17780 [Pseudonocardia petroleophila]|uniref:Uncharacterized protein n=1 Tax=Pseudonocardia petroleophila TaxID=37331 RepID=A0A7G7MDK5_9PSEU|nr:hypothetical protein [Pseudonocardia petroleophila]QNG50866.1 hypothetical protein H6H00_22080 [Pseudonocardia petroleophila]